MKFQKSTVPAPDDSSGDAVHGRILPLSVDLNDRRPSPALPRHPPQVVVPVEAHSVAVWPKHPPAFRLQLREPRVGMGQQQVRRSRLLPGLIGREAAECCCWKIH